MPQVGFTVYKVPDKAADVQALFVIENKHGEVLERGEVHQSKVVEVNPGDVIKIHIPESPENEQPVPSQL